MDEMVLLASKENSKVASVACPICGRISRQILMNEYKSSSVASLCIPHTCPLCGTEFASSSSAQSAKYADAYARYNAQGEQSYNANIKTAFSTTRSQNAQSPNSTSFQEGSAGSSKCELVLLKKKPHLNEIIAICPSCERIIELTPRDIYLKDSILHAIFDHRNCRFCGKVYAAASNTASENWQEELDLYEKDPLSYNLSVYKRYKRNGSLPEKGSNASEHTVQWEKGMHEQGKIHTSQMAISDNRQEVILSITESMEPVTERPEDPTEHSSNSIKSQQEPVCSHPATDSVPILIPKVTATSDSGHSNKTVLKRKVEHWKKQLLDLSKRNKMINYRETKRANLRILEPEFTELFNRLAVSEEELTFQRPIDKDSGLRTFSMLSLLETLSYPIPVHVGDIKAEGSLLERRIALNNLRSKSKLARDEQGTNILYLSFGFIEWRENKSANAQWLKSPVLMMPVSLKLESIQAPYTLLRYDDDIEVNPTLDYLFNERYGIDLPTFELHGEESIEQYMQTIEQIADQHGWKLIREVSLGLLSFLKISMYHDLNNNYERMLKNPVIRAITGDAHAANNIPQELTGFDFDRVCPNDCYQVVNSDSSQQEAILLSKAGVSFVMQGPPGTGKSQTITNIIAEALADGKTILFVSEKAAALQVVYKRLTEAGLDDFCLALHSHKANKKEILDSIAANLNLPRKRMKDSAMFELNELFQEKQALNRYVAELHEEISPLEKSLYEAFGELSLLQKAPYIQFSIESPSDISSTTYNTMLYRVDSYAKALKRLGVKISKNPWRGTVVQMVTQQFNEDLAQVAGGLAESLFVLDEALSDDIGSLGLNESCTWAGAQRVMVLLQAIENTSLFPISWAKQDERLFLIDKAKSGHQEQQEYFQVHQNALACFSESIFSEDLSSWLESTQQTILKVKNIHGHIQMTESEIMARVDSFADLARSTIDQLQAVVSAFERANALAPFTHTDTLIDADSLVEILDLIIHCPAVNASWFDSSILQQTKQIIEEAKSHTTSLLKMKSTLLQAWEPSVLNINSDEILLRFKTDYTSFLKIFKSSYRADIKTIRGVSKKVGVKFSDAEIVTLLQQIGEINKENQWVLEHQQQLNECFGSFYVGETTDWSTIETGISFTEKMCSLFPQGIVPEKVLQLLCDKTSHSADYFEISDILAVLNKEKLSVLSAEISRMILNHSSKSIKEQLIPKATMLLEHSSLLIKLIAQIRLFEVEQIPNSELIERVTEANLVCAKRIALEKTYAEYKELFGDRIEGLSTDWDSIILDLESVSALLSINEANLMTDDFVSAFCDDIQYRGKLIAAKEDLQSHISECNVRYSKFKSLFEEAADFDNTRISIIADRVGDCLANSMLLDNWISCVETRNSCDEIGLSDFTDKIVQLDNSIEDVVGTFKYGFLMLWVQSVIGTKKTVEQFRRYNQDEKIKRFVALDQKQLLIAQERIRQNVISGIPDTNRVLSANDELSILQREIGKKRRIMPLRKLFKSIPNLLLKLKPCMMMSPLSVAYFLEAESYEFDMIIFDEASQIFPQDAVGSIFRGNQVIIAGDSKQLPPTNFFSTSTSNDDDGFDEDDDEAVGTEIYDSILEETTGVLPNRTLLWHYRSKHENLIAFSNQEIYKNELVTFPSSVNNGADTGVEFVFVDNGIYEGKGRNTSEARRCVELVRQHIERTPNRSLGIIAFSESQQKTISLEIQKFREQHSEYESFFAEDREGEFFVKNLENVQGDERDTIIFSVSYAKTKEQRDNNRSMALRFGPLGQKGGERRLNVAITRAKTNVKLVSSILPSDIDLSRTESEGVKMLRQYIEFAMNGSSSLRGGQDEAEKDVFLDVVAEYLIVHGYKVQKYVGCSGYKIDLAVLHPSNDDCFVAGIECDGFSYAVAKSARDRDHLRKSVLEAMGWRTYRVWSPEWIARQDIEGQKLLIFIDTAIKEYQEIKKVEPAKPITQTQVESFAEVIEGPNTGDTSLLIASIADDTSNPYGFAEYTEAVWHETPRIKQLYGDDRIAEVIKYIVEIEQPIYIDLLYQRMAGVFGNQKATAPVRNAVEQVMRGSKLKSFIARDADGFVTLAGFKDVKARVPAYGNPARQINFISLDEIGVAMLTIAGQAIGLTTEGLIEATVKALGYARKGERMMTCMSNALERLIKRNCVKLVDEKVRVLGGDNRGQ